MCIGQKNKKQGDFILEIKNNWLKFICINLLFKMYHTGSNTFTIENVLI